MSLLLCLYFATEPQRWIFCGKALCTKVVAALPPQKGAHNILMPRLKLEEKWMFSVRISNWSIFRSDRWRRWWKILTGWSEISWIWEGNFAWNTSGKRLLTLYIQNRPGWPRRVRNSNFLQDSREISKLTWTEVMQAAAEMLRRHNDRREKDKKEKRAKQSEQRALLDVIFQEFSENFLRIFLCIIPWFK